ncbi:ABC transporter ATP-binding protein [Alicyclobacillus macrosporangiidus]|uniref:Branched-chain amino acid transport system ATP-binding protein n=1 Tax=Alicyclobacillus macrosporangiidus TaxID=392015 RepID=A0A1I7H1T3_9BACL|nr:ABC transporter ATP-binding protein [Alicyclobacillus macrosporangiidus]SFU54630.1 branched-chain amino acid transport system ATP-binding protein [Alicyclobacillus macrosporangiidus]
MSFLVLENVHVYYGGVHALKGVSLTVEQGEIVTLIGANGAGKTTTLRAVCAQVKVREGRVTFQGRDITNQPTHEVVSLGIGHVPEGRRIFSRLTVKENLDIGAFSVRDKSLVKRRLEQVFACFPRLKERLNQKAGTLSGGEQQMLAIGRALMSEPSLLLLDEPSMGLAPVVVEQIFDILKDLNQRGTTLLLVEQNAFQALQLAHRGYVIQNGEIRMADAARTLLENEEVKAAYLA